MSQLKEQIGQRVRETWADGGIGADATANAILALIIERVEQVRRENPYEEVRLFDGFDEACQAILNALAE